MISSRNFWQQKKNFLAKAIKSNAAGFDLTTPNSAGGDDTTRPLRQGTFSLTSFMYTNITYSDVSVFKFFTKIVQLRLNSVD
jgi:hypothetical protein